MRRTMVGQGWKVAVALCGFGLGGCEPLPLPGTKDDTVDDTETDDTPDEESDDDTDLGVLRDLALTVERLVTGAPPEATLTERDGRLVSAATLQVLALSRESTAVEPLCPPELQGGCLSLKAPITWVTIQGDAGFPVGAGLVVPTGFPPGAAFAQGVAINGHEIGISTAVAVTVLARNGDEDADGLSNLDEEVFGSDMFDPDSDDDGLSDGEEIEVGASPIDADTDDDGLGDAEEVAAGTDPSRADVDQDGLDDPAELALGTDPSDDDTDEDGVRDGDEAGYGTDPLDADSDNDSLLDGAEVALGTDPLDTDSDDDLRNDAIEISVGTDPLDPDTDDDGLDDRAESLGTTDPLDPDTDNDLLLDGQEALYLCDPLLPDTDFDSVSDGDEVALGSNPRRGDTDADGLPDGEEVALGTNLTLADTDGDCLLDGDEGPFGGDPRVDDADTLVGDLSAVVDCRDPACAGIPSCPETCDDGVDNDGDGFLDCQDAGCDNSPLCVERLCLDGVDDDRDGLLDCEDDDCLESALCAEVDCADGADNDLDASTDCGDEDCWNESVCAPVVHVSAGMLRRTQDNVRHARACDVGQFPPPGTPPYDAMGVDYGSWTLSVQGVAGTVSRPGLAATCGFTVDRVAWREPENGGGGPWIPTRDGFQLDPGCALTHDSGFLPPFLGWARGVNPQFQVAGFPARPNGLPAAIPTGTAYIAASAPGRNRVVSSSTTTRVDTNFFPSWCIFFNTYEQKSFGGPVTGP
jgi:hypothetical protein